MNIFLICDSIYNLSWIQYQIQNNLEVSVFYEIPFYGINRFKNSPRQIMVLV